MTKARKRARAAKPEKTARSKKAAAAEEAFRRAAAARGDAVRTADGKLPPGATFELQGVDEGGTPVIKRKRFSMG